MSVVGRTVRAAPIVAVIVLAVWSAHFAVDVRAAEGPWISGVWALNRTSESWGAETGGRVGATGALDFAAALPLVSKGFLHSPALPSVCRLGVVAWGDQLANFDLISNFGVGLYLDFGLYAGTVSAMQGAEYAHMIMVGQDRPDDPTDVNLPVACGPDYGYTMKPALTDAGLGRMLAANPGHLWIIGNEPDRRVSQNDTCPQQYAEAYHDAYHFIKSRDPSAQVAVAGLVEVTPGRLQYLDIVYNTYRNRYGQTMPVDVWTAHIYILSETSHGDAHVALGTDPNLAISHSLVCSDPKSYCYAEHDDIGIFAQQVMMMRTWMRNHGYQSKPLVLSEFGINLPYHYYGTCNSRFCPAVGCFCDTNGETFHPARVADYLRATFTYLENARSTAIGNPLDSFRLVQQWTWFSVEQIGPGSSSNLLASNPDDSYVLSQAGAAYQAWAAALAKQANLFPVRVTARPEGAGGTTSPVTVTLMVEIANNGNLAVTRPASVTFYSDANLAHAIGTASISYVPGCARQGQMAEILWSNLPAGVHYYWVKVDSNNEVNESAETDNVMSGVVFANGFRTLMPLVMRSF